MQHSSLVHKLDLGEYITKFENFLAREKPIAMQGDTNLHYNFIQTLASIEFPHPKPTPNLDNEINRLQKQAVLSLEQIYEFVKIVDYFNSLKAINLPLLLSKWIHSIDIPPEIENISTFFTDDGHINAHKDEELYSLGEAIVKNKKSIKEHLASLLGSSTIKEYLVDAQIHFINDEETLLVRGGFSNAIKASVVGRSAGGFFYILPNSLGNLKDKEASLLSQQESIIFRYCKDFSAIFHTWWRFLKFINKEFDRFDSYQARVAFARANDFEFVLPNKSNKIVLSEFKHPALREAVPISLNLEKKIMLVTGVNAGGKTMLLKSILSSAWMSKYLLPFSCDVAKTSIGHFGDIEAIIDDPQSVKNDISTFAGRMREFAKLFEKKNAIVGVDEIELGTDSDEAASLFRVLLDSLASRDIVFVVTTHHKRLASLMASHNSVELVAALYDEEKRLPTYTFLQGSIGKSYAFETAARYGIPVSVVEKAKEVHGEDKERLNELIERSTTLEQQMRQKIATLDEKNQKLTRQQQKLIELEDQIKQENKNFKHELQKQYNDATQMAKEALKVLESKEGRRLLNNANKKLATPQKIEPEKKEIINIGDIVKYRSFRGIVLEITAQGATLDIDGMKIKVAKKDIRLVHEKQKTKTIKPQSTTKVEKGNASVSVKLIGMYGDEAIDTLDRFLSNALVHGLSEIQVIHGGGKGILAKLISEYLSSHPKISKFYRMSGNLGITIVEL